MKKIQVIHDTKSSVPLAITSYLHCKKCLEELANDKSIKQSPKDYARTQIGMTEKGFQVW